MKHLAILLALFTAACSSPTSPSPAATTPPVTVTPPVVTPPVTPADDGLTRDPRFSLTFYRTLVRDSYENPSALQPLRRQTGAPFLYLHTIDDAGRTVDARELDATAAALINTAGALTGKFGVSGLMMGTDPSPSIANVINVFFVAATGSGVCGRANVGGDTIHLYHSERNCLCNGVIRPYTVKHELGHVLGFYHTGDPQDLMSGLSVNGCDKDPSEREKFHALVAYSRPIGSLDP